MKQSGNLNIALLIFATLIIVLAFFIILLPPQEITLKDITPNTARHTTPMEPVFREAHPVDRTVSDSDDKVKAGYYIIVESNKSLTEAQRKAEKLTEIFNANFIVLPPTPEGYFRISFGKYSKLEEADSVIKKIRTNIRTDAWVLSVRK